MSSPSTPQQLSCILNKLADRKVFTYTVNVAGKAVTKPMPNELVREAISEFVTACDDAYFRSIEPTASQKLMGMMFLPAIDHFLTQETLKQVTEPEPS